MTPIVVIVFASLSAVYLVYGICIWRMPEKRWLDFSRDRNHLSYLIGNYKTKYNPKKVRPISIAYLLFEAVCNLMVGLTFEEHPLLAKIFMGGVIGAAVVYGVVVLVFCKER